MMLPSFVRDILSMLRLPSWVYMIAIPLGLMLFGGAYWLLVNKQGMETTQAAWFLGGLVVVLVVIGFVIGGIVTWLRGRREKRMESALQSGEAIGPVDMETKETIKKQSDRFIAAVRDFRKRKKNVYALPWYMTIGEPGCGKTRLINEAKLHLAGAKPENYKLGTADYNWWFTEHAIFIDMAGALVMPDTESHVKQWNGILEAIARGRKGYPLNGVLLCVAAKELLQDGPDETERKAEILRERLRDLQHRLDVTFATYVIVTKCDLIRGFMAFFDRVSQNVDMRNQMFGWSRPGDYKEAYNPESFPPAFDDVYRRLCDLRTQRLEDAPDEPDRASAYCFPEEFRALEKPLQKYLEILFPFIKDPAGIPNLVFRGVYFTSATQEGSVVVKQLMERHGDAAQELYKPLQDLYPNPKAHFIHDLLHKKVFKEYGLVYKDVKQVKRNRKLEIALWVSTAILGIATFSTLWWASNGFDEAINDPREKAVTAAKLAADTSATEAQAVEQVASLDGGAEALKNPNAAGKVLAAFAFGDVTQPRRQITQSSNFIFAHHVLRDYFAQLDKSLGTYTITDEDSLKKLLDALIVRVEWHGCRDWVIRHQPKELDKLEAVLANPNLHGMNPETFEGKLRLYMDTVGKFAKSQESDPEDAHDPPIGSPSQFLPAELDSADQAWDALSNWLRDQAKNADKAEAFDLDKLCNLATACRDLQTHVRQLRSEGKRTRRRDYEPWQDEFAKKLVALQKTASNTRKPNGGFTSRIEEFRRVWGDVGADVSSLSACDESIARAYSHKAEELGKDCDKALRNSLERLGLSVVDWRVEPDLGFEHIVVESGGAYQLAEWTKKLEQAFPKLGADPEVGGRIEEWKDILAQHINDVGNSTKTDLEQASAWDAWVPGGAGRKSLQGWVDDVHMLRTQHTGDVILERILERARNRDAAFSDASGKVEVEYVLLGERVGPSLQPDRFVQGRSDLREILAMLNSQLAEESDRRVFGEKSLTDAQGALTKLLGDSENQFLAAWAAGRVSFARRLSGSLGASVRANKLGQFVDAVRGLKSVVEELKLAVNEAERIGEVEGGNSDWAQIAGDWGKAQGFLEKLSNTQEYKRITEWSAGWAEAGVWSGSGSLLKTVIDVRKHGKGLVRKAIIERLFEDAGGEPRVLASGDVLGTASKLLQTLKDTDRFGHSFGSFRRDLEELRSQMRQSHEVRVTAKLPRGEGANSNDLIAGCRTWRLEENQPTATQTKSEATQIVDVQWMPSRSLSVELTFDGCDQRNIRQMSQSWSLLDVQSQTRKILRDGKALVELSISGGELRDPRLPKE